MPNTLATNGYQPALMTVRSNYNINNSDEVPMGSVLFVSRSGTLFFQNPVHIRECHDPNQVVPLLKELEDILAQGFYIAGFITYEAGWVFMDRLPQKTAPGLPLAWFGVYHKVTRGNEIPDTELLSPPIAWQPGISRERYEECLEKIRYYIGAGDVYQVNYTFPLKGEFGGDAFRWFTSLYNTQPTDHAAFLDMGRFKILSLSPELFFEVDGDRLKARPMKGTLARGLYGKADLAIREILHKSEKNRAENLMIVDLLRNDLGRISEIGSVKVDRLFEVERFATLWQMTSTIVSRSHASFGEILASLFPCGSVTGAPKFRAMEIIDELEDHPRGVYCGAIGWWAPTRRASFNVAIRTITLDTQQQRVEYPVGGGITWYSSTQDEYHECLTKAKAVHIIQKPFELLETLLFDKEYFLLERHLDRLCASAAYFDIPVCREDIRRYLDKVAVNLSPGYWKIRLLVDRKGNPRVEVHPAPAACPVSVGLAKTPIDKNNVFLYHKTTIREHYKQAVASCPGVQDVLLWNDAGELTETTTANIVVKIQGEWLTPPISSGLLPGVMREELLTQGIIREAPVLKERVKDIEALFLINSVRKKIPAFLSGDLEIMSPPR